MMETQVTCNKCNAIMERIPKRPIEKLLEGLLLGTVKIRRYKCYACFKSRTIFVRNS